MLRLFKQQAQVKVCKNVLFLKSLTMESMMEHYKKLIANSEITAASAVKNLMSASEK